MTLREWEKLRYLDPKRILVSLRKIAEGNPVEEMPYDIASLRTRELRPYGEARQCALFCYGLSQALSIDVGFTQLEKSDYDFVACYPQENVMNYVPIQMKELVPEHLNAKTDLNQEIAKLAKYADSENLVVAIHLNRAGRMDFNDLEISGLNIRELWLFGASSPDQSHWWLLGDMLNNPKVYEFSYPEP